MSRRTIIAGACALVATISALGTSASAHAAPPITGHAGRWVVDKSGRVVIVHGVSLSSKGLSGGRAYPAGIGFGSADAEVLAANGLDAVRLTFERHAFAPEPGQFDYAYLAQFKDTMKLLWRHGIYSLIDFHQDDYGPAFHDNGFPDWMVQTDGVPNLNTLPFPQQYVANTALWHAFDHFWANDPDPAGHGKLQADDIEILKTAVARLKGTDGLMGFEIMNEPFPGSDFQKCLNLDDKGCADFERTKLSPYYDRVVAALRKIDRNDMIWYEPQVGFDFGFPTFVVPPKAPNLGFAYHDYCPLADPTSASCARIDRQVQKYARDHVDATHNALLETEFGSVTDPTTLVRLTNLYDSNMVPWMFWLYNGVLVRGNGRTEAIPPGTRHLVSNVVGAIVRPYPQVVAGTPTSWSYDAGTKVFRLRYTTARAEGGGRFPARSKTVVYMPPRQYRAGYDVKVTGGRVVSRPDASTLVISSNPKAKQVTVRATAKG
jgi:endoglycosylceramidase